ncbi:MAG: DEAD/DEAH box helicase [Sedimentisphaerales bacterium]|nr:DEAD/DEAH box helicase [Sedimentisphaerales bacterium]
MRASSTLPCVVPDAALRDPDYSWQIRAITCWENAGRRGIIEAVTGSGKTHVAIEALARLSHQDPALSSLIVVPTIPLMEQWYEKLRERFPERRVGRIGGRYRDEFKILPLAYVATIQSALRRAADLWRNCWEPRCGDKWKSLLIADECHHYIDAAVWRQIVGPSYKWSYRMGLTATIGPYKAEGLGQIVTTYSFREAYRDGLIPSFDLRNVRVHLTPSENDRYFELSDRISDQFRKVFRAYAHELRNVPDHWLFKRLQQLMGTLGSGRGPEIEKLFLLLFRRAEVYYMAAEKMNLAEILTRRFVARGRKILVFFERIAAAEQVNDRIALHAARRLQKRLTRGSAMWCKTFHSQMNRDERTRVLQRFRDQKAAALIVCRSLDEGVDIPDVDGAILAASTRSARQRVQRIGRTLRRGDGTKRPVIVTLFAGGTGDEGVTENDRVEFQGIADICDADIRDGTGALTSILDRKRSRPPDVEMQTREWICVAEADPIEPCAISRLMSHIRDGELIKLEYADGTTRTGRYRYCMSHVIWFHGGSATTDGLIRIQKETV